MRGEGVTRCIKIVPLLPQAHLTQDTAGRDLWAAITIRDYTRFRDAISVPRETFNVPWRIGGSGILLSLIINYSMVVKRRLSKGSPAAKSCG